jgi:hypothetical protein
MTHDRHDHGSVHDVTFVLAEGRIADLQASASPTTRVQAVGAPRSSSIVARTRDAVGRRVITLGGFLATDEGLRRRGLHL